MALIETGIGIGASLLFKVRGGKATEAQTQQLAVRYWGCILFEVNFNMKNLLASLVMANSTTTPMLAFDVYDSTIGDLCRIDPMPSTIALLNNVVSPLKQIDRTITMELSNHNMAGDWADTSNRYLADFCQDYESLCNLLNDAGRVAFTASDWQQIATTIVPGILPEMKPHE